MADLNRPAGDNSIIEEPRKIPEMLNVLTILTFIGSGLGIVSALWGFARAKASYDQLASMNLDQMPDFAKRMMGNDPVEMARRSLENRLPILLLSLIGCALCIYGAIQMRKLKKTGYTFYVLGEVLPIITSAIFLGTGALMGFGGIIGTIIVLVFIILYASQLKYLR
ncbi:hypothetical protein [Puia dinghuensis]|uniref:DUF4064 domain-containing protein n=1 Tax=Puia dinghuensis TaxID=1792502 RepID=A0A8J2UE11_9BACT|nr:hypothetical protein [Puia dinghuensis]GGB04681.1 hypothetical protein GCM10011511_29980 [Puia dinghuensis]